MILDSVSFGSRCALLPFRPPSPGHRPPLGHSAMIHGWCDAFQESVAPSESVLMMTCPAPSQSLVTRPPTPTTITLTFTKSGQQLRTQLRDHPRPLIDPLQGSVDALWIAGGQVPSIAIRKTFTNTPPHASSLLPRTPRCLPAYVHRSDAAHSISSTRRGCPSVDGDLNSLRCRANSICHLVPEHSQRSGFMRT